MITQIAQSIPGVGGFAGALIGAAGGVFGALFSSRDPVRVNVADFESRAHEKLRDARAGPDRVVTIIELGGQEIGRVERELALRTARDEVVRYGDDARPLRP
jgi:hypothetical protein